MKKFTALLMMFIAYAILIAHSMIPHEHVHVHVHHHEHHILGHEHNHTPHYHHTSEHDHSQQSHSESHDSNDLTHLFAHFIHSLENFTFTVAHSFTNTFNKQQHFIAFLMPDSLSISEFLSPYTLLRPHSGLFHANLQFPGISGLRAPPLS